MAGMHLVLSLYSMPMPVLKVNLIILEDRHLTSSKYDVNPCAHGGDPLDQKMWTDRQTDSFLALYIWEGH